jgi:protein-S-isoprenylcysteine O-methyltransferase Ste14
VLFVSAGTLDWPAAWAWVAIVVASGLAMAPVLDPALMRERLTAIPIRRTRTAGDRWGIAMGLIFAAWLPLMGLDAVRFGWTSPPAWTRVVGGIAVVAGDVVAGLALLANRFASSAVRVQAERGQTVVSDGPYAFVRHPMYSGVLLFLPGTALLLGSYVGLALSGLMICTVLLRTSSEDALLREELDGYVEYAARVRYRVIPQVW